MPRRSLPASGAASSCRGGAVPRGPPSKGARGPFGVGVPGLRVGPPLPLDARLHAGRTDGTTTRRPTCLEKGPTRARRCAGLHGCIPYKRAPSRTRASVIHIESPFVLKQDRPEPRVISVTYASSTAGLDPPVSRFRRPFCAGSCSPSRVTRSALGQIRSAAGRPGCSAPAGAGGGMVGSVPRRRRRNATAGVRRAQRTRYARPAPVLPGAGRERRGGQVHPRRPGRAWLGTAKACAHLAHRGAAT